MALTYNLFVEQGADFQNVITVSNDDGTPKDLTGYVAESKMRRSYGSTAFVEIVATVSNASAGEITLSLTSAVTELLKSGRYVYDMKITSGDVTPVVTRIVEGLVTVSPNVTRDDA